MSESYTLNIEIASDDIKSLQSSGYKLCIARQVNDKFNVVRESIECVAALPHAVARDHVIAHYTHLPDITWKKIDSHYRTSFRFLGQNIRRVIGVLQL
jgi:hypothetical protein